MPLLEKNPEVVNWIAHDHLADLLLIIPPDGALSPFSNLTPDRRGKTPGLPTPDGWVGHRGWTKENVSYETLAQRLGILQNARYSIGLQARRLHAFDVDTTDEHFARAVYRALMPFVAAHGYGLRVGRPPGFLVPFRTATPRHKARLEFVHEATGETAHVELLGVGQQYVVQGTHPKTGKPYHWFPGPCGVTLPEAAREARPAAEDEQLDRLWSELPDKLARASWRILAPSRRHSLKTANGQGGQAIADRAPGLDALQEALSWLPNDPRRARSREGWVAIAHALVGASGKSEEARALFLDWSAQWRDDAEAVDNAERLWEGIDAANVHVGWRWLAGQADNESAGRAGLLVAEDFSDLGEDSPEEAAALAGAEIFDEPQRERPTAEEVEAAISDLDQLSDNEEIHAVLRLIVLAQPGSVAAGRSLKEVKRRTGVPIGDLKADMAQIAREDSPEPDVGKRLADTVLAAYGADKLAWWQGSWWRYNGRHWEPYNALVLKKTMQEIIIADRGLLFGGARELAMTAAIDQALEMLQAMVGDRFERTKELDFALRPAINLRNGTIWVDVKAGKVNFAEHNPDDLFTYACDVDYDPRATAERYEALVADTMSRTCYTLLPGETDYTELRQAIDAVGASEADPLTLADGRRAWRERRQIFVADQKENLRLLEEMLGYALVPWRGASAFSIWKGNGRNGKSMLVETLKRFLSSDAVFVHRIEELDANRFALAELAGKLVFVDDDMAYRAMLPDGVLKTISENRLVHAAKKYQSPMAFTCTTFPVLLCNAWPVTRDLSHGLRYRAVVVPFNRRFTSEELKHNPWPDIWINDKEMSGVLNRWLAGLLRVLRRGQIAGTRASEEAKADWLNHNTPEVEFLREACTSERPAGVTSSGDGLTTIYSAYMSWYITHIGSRTYSHGRRRFREVLEQLGYQVGRAGSRGDFIKGLWLTDDNARMAGGNLEFGLFGDDNETEEEDD